MKNAWNIVLIARVPKKEKEEEDDNDDKKILSERMKRSRYMKNSDGFFCYIGM